MQSELNKKILDAIDEGHVGDSHLSGFDENKVANAIERIVIQTQLDLLFTISDNMVLDCEQAHEDLGKKIQELTNQLNQIK